jgi:hypothetical protein
MKILLHKYFDCNILSKYGVGFNIELKIPEQWAHPEENKALVGTNSGRILAKLIELTTPNVLIRVRFHGNQFFPPQANVKPGGRLGENPANCGLLFTRMPQG